MRRLVLLAAAVLVTGACTNIPGLTQRVCPNRWFDEADYDHDRVVTRAEYERWRAACTTCEAWAGWFMVGDADGDGRVTLAETCNIKGVPYVAPSGAPSPSLSAAPGGAP